MRTKLAAVVVVTLSGVGLSGCFPSFLTSRPEAEIIVTDEAGTPLPGATVTLGTMEWHGIVGRNTLTRFVTDAKGRVEFDDEHKWALQIMLPDGDVRYSWSLCFSKPGYEAIPKIFNDFDRPIRVAMYPSAVVSECEWPRYESTPRVPQREARWIEVAGGAWQSNIGITRILDEEIRGAMEASAREQGIELRSWSEYRFQYLTGGDHTRRDTYIQVHAFCRAPADADLTTAFYTEPDGGSCFFETRYLRQVWADQPPSRFGPLQIVGGKT